MPHVHSDIANLDMCARMITAAGKRLAGHDPNQLARLADLHRIVDNAMVVAIAGQRAQGITWDWIGESLGVTKQAVIQRFGPRISA